MDKMKMHSPNMTQENIARIRELFPNCITEAKDESGKLKLAVDFDQLKQELSESIVEGPQERYHLNWPGKREALLTANAPIAKTLRPCVEESVDFDTTKNLFIEGDNLDALKLLQETYLGKVKMIYIDPPYNTGKDFIYADDFAESTEEYLLDSGQKDEKGNRLVANSNSNGRFHSDWLSMMYPRLKLAKNLLKDDGAIFISIDDNEVHTLRKVCDEVFGEDNFVALIPVINNMKGRNDKSFHAQIHEYLIVYKNMSFVSNGLQISVEKRAEYNQTSSDGRKFQWRDLRKRGGADTRRERPNLYYPIYVNPGNGLLSLSDSEDFSVEVLPVKSNGEDGRWRWGKSTLSARLANVAGRPVQRKDSWNISYRVFLDDPELGERREKPKSVWIGSEFSTDSGTKAVNSLLPRIDAKEIAPKALGQITRILELATGNADIILDFFAGSATTTHAVMKLNAEDGGDRKFIMVQLPEACHEKSEAFKAGYKTIAEISKERIRRAGKKILEELTTESAGEHGKDKDNLFSSSSVPSVSSVVKKDLDIGFRVLKVDSSNMADVYYTPDAITQNGLALKVDNVKEGRTSEDLLFQVLLDWGVDLSLPIRKEVITTENTKHTENKNKNASVPSVSSVVKKSFEVFFVDENALVACFDSGVNEELVKELTKYEPLRVVFRDNGFASDAVKINVEQIFKQMSSGTEVKSI